MCATACRPPAAAPTVVAALLPLIAVVFMACLTIGVALAWLLAQKPWMVPIPGTRKLGRLEENLGAVAVELTPGDLRDIKSAASKITVQGDPYPEHLERLSYR
jgi:aryl-alcohol dehydrogenase-like predicted oxidoreductase